MWRMSMSGVVEWVVVKSAASAIGRACAVRLASSGLGFISDGSRKRGSAAARFLRLTGRIWLSASSLPSGARPDHFTYICTQCFTCLSSTRLLTL